jgi:transcriptional regulator with XRE-family HTH domain
MAEARRHLQQSEWGQTLAQHMATSRDCKTQGALARKSGVAQSTIGRILRGETNPQTATMSYLAEALGKPIQNTYWCR